MEDQKIFLSEKDMPKKWYNINPDLPKPLPPLLHPGTKKPATPDDISMLFPMGLIMQEVSQERWIEIPDEVYDIYRLWRPTPLQRAGALEKYLQTPAKIYFKNEGVSPSGSHKTNTAIAQAYYNKKEGIKRLATETGAGQWGSALSFACNIFGLKCTVYMVKISYQQKPYRKSLMHLWGAEVIPSPSDRTEAGKMLLAQDPKSKGSLGGAISEAVEDAAKHDDTHYSLGSVLNHVCMHQTIIGLEVKKQLEIAGDYPDILIGCVGGGSNFSGFAFPFIHDKLKEGKNIRFIAVEPTACPTLTKGVYAFDYGDAVKSGPIAKMYTLGHDFMPAGIHAGGLRYHGDAPQLSLLHKEKVIEAVAYKQKEIFEAAMIFARTEGYVPAPETAHAIKCAIDEALKCRESGEKKTIVFNFSGHGHFDLAAYDNYLSGKLRDTSYPRKKVQEALGKLPQVDELTL